MNKEYKDLPPEEQQRQARENAHVFLVRALAEVVAFAKKNYYNGFVTLSDENYDRIEGELRKLCPAHPALVAVGDAPFSDMLLGVVETRALVKEALKPRKVGMGPALAHPYGITASPPPEFVDTTGGARRWSAGDFI